MFKALKAPILIVNYLVLTGLITNCGDKRDDVKPEHKVEVRFQATALPEDYYGQFYVEEDWGLGATTTYMDNPSGAESHTHTAAMAKLPGHTIEAMIRISDNGSTRSLSASTFLKAEILVDGKVQKTITVDRNTKADSDGDRELTAMVKL
jgi:hypothetical protein